MSRSAAQTPGADAGHAPVSPAARRVHLLLALVAAAALLLRLVLTIAAPDADDAADALATRLLHYASYFTIESNAVVLAASLAILVGAPLGSTFQRTLRLASLVGIVVTGIVYAVLLAPQSDATGLSLLASRLLHVVVPIGAVVAWLAVGPWPSMRPGDVLRLMVWPVTWIAWILLLGGLSGWYPYDFLDPATGGWGRVAVFLAVIVGAAALLGLLIGFVDRLRARTA